MKYDHNNDWDAAFDALYLRWFHLKGEPAVVRITNIESGVELVTRGNRKSRRCLLHYELVSGSIEKRNDPDLSSYPPLVLNVTNRDSIKDIHGRLRTDCIGKEIEFYQTEDRLGRKMVPCIRIRPSNRKGAKATAAGQPQPPSEADQLYIDDTKGEIATAETLEALKMIGVAIKGKPKAIQDALRAEYTARVEALKSVSACELCHQADGHADDCQNNPIGE